MYEKCFDVDEIFFFEPKAKKHLPFFSYAAKHRKQHFPSFRSLSLYTSDAADDLTRVDIRGFRLVIKKKKKQIIANSLWLVVVHGVDECVDDISCCYLGYSLV